MDDVREATFEAESPFGITFVGHLDDLRGAFHRLALGEQVTFENHYAGMASVDFQIDINRPKGEGVCVEVGHELFVDPVDPDELANLYAEARGVDRG